MIAITSADTATLGTVFSSLDRLDETLRELHGLSVTKHAHG